MVLNIIFAGIEIQLDTTDMHPQSRVIYRLHYGSVILGLILFAVSVYFCLITSDFNTAMEFGSFGAVGLIVGCVTALCNSYDMSREASMARLRICAVLWLCGVLLTALGFGTSMYLSSRCDRVSNTTRMENLQGLWLGDTGVRKQDEKWGSPQESTTLLSSSTSSNNCPLPSWIDSDGVFHSMLLGAYLLMGIGILVSSPVFRSQHPRYRRV